MYGDSPKLSTDSASIFVATSKAKHGSISKNKEELFMESQFENSNQNSLGLLRFRSAPSSFPEIFSGEVISNCNKGTHDNNGLCSKFNIGAVNGQNKAVVNDFVALNPQLPPPYPRQNSSTQLGSMDSRKYPLGNMEAKLGSNLMRQNSSPAGLFTHLSTTQNGYGVGGYRMASGANGDMISSSSRLKTQLSFPSGTPSSLGMLSQISEVENESTVTTGPDDEKTGNGNLEAQFYNSGLPFASWSDASNFPETFSNNKGKLFANAKFEIEQLGNRPPILSHHLSLPKAPAEIAAMEKLLQIQETVPCKIRAKRGCATHPRSIAERVRRTRISERMRKLQELVPNMDKQTNTADMLDLAVEYIKDLQKQYKTLTDCRANCKCSAMQHPVSNQRV